jgi:coenzyme F420-reducing hydrogenase delta subunit/formate hydrogenlyase subunit 6/NADH:ubiquinone oxidoreductase subunit I
MPQYAKLDPTFREQIMAEPGGENLLRCLACGTCMAACLIRRVEPDYNPRRILRMAATGLKDEVLNSPLIWLCSSCDVCYSRCPQNIHISELMTAIRDIAVREGHERPGSVAEVDEELCSGCGVCVTACPYEAIQLMVRDLDNGSHREAQVDRSLCMSCGICAAACPTSAINIEGFDDTAIAMQMQAGNWFAEESADPKIMLFICDWCLRADADLKALTGLPEDVRVVNVPCSGRVDPSFVLFALVEGADGVLVIGCQPGECHYMRGTYISQGRTSLLEEVLAQMGVVDGRVRFARIGSADRGKLPRLVEEMRASVRDLEALRSGPVLG